MRDAFIIADTARTMPHTLSCVDTSQETSSELGVLVGFDDDLTGEAIRLSNRIRGLLTGIHPALERVLGPRVATRSVARTHTWSAAGEHAPGHGIDEQDPLVIDLDATLVTAHSDKEKAAPNYNR